MFGEKRHDKREVEEAEKLAREQAEEAEQVTETDDSTIDPDEALEAEEEPE